MAMLPNPRHELFAQGLAKGLSGKAAYCEAGYRSNGNAAEVGAAKLVRNSKVAARVAELQARQVRRLDTTVQSLVAELEQARVGAMAARQYSAATMASLGKAKLLGLIVDRAEVESLRKPLREPLKGPARQMSLEEWQRTFAPRGTVLASDAAEPAQLDEPEKTESMGIVGALGLAKAGLPS